VDKNFGFSYEQVSLDEARELVAPRPVMRDYSRLRKPQNPNDIRLTHVAAQWVLAFPGTVRPLALAKRYPRIANVLAKAWAYPAAFEARLAEYMLDDRGTRQGFPLDVARDFAKLKDHFIQNDKRVERDVWDNPHF
jgi:hypothetical protein